MSLILNDYSGKAVIVTSKTGTGKPAQTVFEDENSKMNLSLLDIEGDLMLISQFTLLADTRKGRRPSFLDAGDPKMSEATFNKFVEKAKDKVKNVQIGWFGEFMTVELVNNGPTTILMESK